MTLITLSPSWLWNWKVVHFRTNFRNHVNQNSDIRMKQCSRQQITWPSRTIKQPPFPLRVKSTQVCLMSSMNNTRQCTFPADTTAALAVEVLRSWETSRRMWSSNVMMQKSDSNQILSFQWRTIRMMLWSTRLGGQLPSSLNNSITASANKKWAKWISVSCWRKKAPTAQSCKVQIQQEKLMKTTSLTSWVSGHEEWLSHLNENQTRAWRNLPG